jgi:hypothetical protein
MYKQGASKRQACACTDARTPVLHVQHLQGMSNRKNNSNLESSRPTLNKDSSYRGLAAHTTLYHTLVLGAQHTFVMSRHQKRHGSGPRMLQ